jgi:hypothetical protein
LNKMALSPRNGMCFIAPLRSALLNRYIVESLNRNF